MKKQLRQLLAQQCMHEIAEMAASKRRVLSMLVALTFDQDPLIGWRAVEAMGTCASRIASSDPACVRDHLRRLYWLLSEESGGICWRAPEAMAEIVRAEPGLFGDYVPIIVSLIQEMAEEDLAHFRSGILWAIGRLAPVAPEAVEGVLGTVWECLARADSQVRGMAVWCLAQYGRGKSFASRDDLLQDESQVVLYEGGHLIHTTVAQLAQRIGAAPAGQ